MATSTCHSHQFPRFLQNFRRLFVSTEPPNEEPLGSLRARLANMEAQVAMATAEQQNGSSTTKAMIVSRRFRIQFRVTSALESAYSLIEASKSTTDFNLRHSMVTQAIGIVDAVSAQIINPMSYFHAQPHDVQTTKQLQLLSQSTLIQLLCEDGYIKHREAVLEGLRRIIEIAGYKILERSDCNIQIPIMRIKQAIEEMKWSPRRRLEEWYSVADMVPNDPHFAGLQFWTHVSVLRLAMPSFEEALKNGEIDEIKESIPRLKQVVEGFKAGLQIMSSPERLDLLPLEQRWKTPEHYAMLGSTTVERVKRLCQETDVRWYLRQGDALLSLATDRIQNTDPEYFRFQALLALDSYRAAYNCSTGLDDFDAELKGKCLWAMGHVMGRYLDRHDQAHELFVETVKLITSLSGVLPGDPWYADAVDQIQQHRQQMQDKEARRNCQDRRATMEALTVQLNALQCRAESVRDEYSLREFLQWLLRTYPPRCREVSVNMVGLLESRELRKVVLNVVGVYDVKKNEGSGKEWQVLSEEIVKVLPLRYLLTLDCK
jgi:hypothetical protein